MNEENKQENDDFQLGVACDLSNQEDCESCQ